MKRKSMGVVSSCALAAGTLMACQAVRADIPYSNGFETSNSQDDFFGTTGSNGSYGAGLNISRMYTGTNGIPAASGNYYAQVNNVNNDYFDPEGNPTPGIGQAVYTAFNSSGNADENPAPNGFFTESTAVYVNLTPSTYGYWAPPTTPGTPAFWIDSSPAGDASDGAYAGYADYRDEVNFQISVPTAGTVNVNSNFNPTTFATINSTGWYTFLMTFNSSGGPYVQNVLSVLNSNGNLLGSATNLSTMPSGDMGGTAYGDWFTLWQNNFAGDTIAIDNVATTPEPGPLALLGLGAVGLLLKRRKRRSV
ncbi:MAG TPA: PEP-CTERM sorting domain-containing protein [Phycisphaerae bacterium]|nr:PEP-CTERM sorting domain-containing protein [Phycisphaerae bacterium]